MPRKSMAPEIHQVLNSYLEEASSLTADESALELSTISRAIKVSRTTLYKPEFLKTIEAARLIRLRRYLLEGKSLKEFEKNLEKSRLQERVKQLEKQLEICLKRNVLIEIRANQLNVDPEELYRSEKGET